MKLQHTGNTRCDYNFSWCIEPACGCGGDIPGRSTEEVELELDQNTHGIVPTIVTVPLVGIYSMVVTEPGFLAVLSLSLCQ